MATDSSLPVGSTGESLETVKTAAGYHREGVFIGDPVTDAARAAVLQTTPNGTTDYGLAAYVLGSVTVLNATLAATQSGTWNIGTLTNLSQLGGQAISMGTGARDAGTLRVTIATNDVVPASQSGTWNIGTVTTVTGVTTVSTVTSLTQMNGQAIAMGTGTRSAGTQRVTIATDDLVPVSLPTLPATATLSNVNDTASSTTLLSSNASRKGAMIQNDSTEILYVKFGTTASATDYTVKMAAGDYYEVPFGYTGRIDGIWANNASGAARVTEIT